MFGCLGVKTVQQSSYGRIEVSKVSILRAICTISSLSMPMTGRKTGSVWHTAFVTAMAGMVWLATWPRLSPVMRPPHSYWMASFSAMRIMKRRMIRVKSSS